MESINSKKNNMEDIDQTRANFLKSIEKFKLTSDALSKLTGLDFDWIDSYLNEKISIRSLPLDMTTQLSNISFMLSDGIKLINFDERNKGIIDVLKELFNISYETIAIYADLDVKDIENFMNDTNSISAEKKYKLATTSLFLYYISKK